MAMDSNGRRWWHWERWAIDMRRSMATALFPIQLHPRELLRKYRISCAISDGNKSAAFRLVDKVASKNEARRLVDYFLKNRTTITPLIRWPTLRHQLLDKVLARLVLEFGLHEVSSSTTGETPGLVTIAGWLKHALAAFENGDGRLLPHEGAAGAYPLSRTLFALLQSRPEISKQNPNLAGAIYYYIAPALVIWFHRGHPVRSVRSETHLLVNDVLVCLLKQAGPQWTLCSEKFLCVSPMLRILREVRPWRMYESSSINALDKMLKGFFSLMFDNIAPLSLGLTIPEFRVGDLLEILGDLLSGVPVQPDNDYFFRVSLSLLFKNMRHLQDSKHKANRRHLIKLAIWFATFLPRHNYNPSDQPVLAQLEDMFPTFVWKIRQPLSLKQNCAITIRHHLGFKRLRQVSQLGRLPPAIESFIEKGFFQVDDALVDYIASERLPWVKAPVHIISADVGKLSDIVTPWQPVDHYPFGVVIMSVWLSHLQKAHGVSSFCVIFNMWRKYWRF